MNHQLDIPNPNDDPLVDLAAALANKPLPDLSSEKYAKMAELRRLLHDCSHPLEMASESGTGHQQQQGPANSLTSVFSLQQNLDETVRAINLPSQPAVAPLPPGRIQLKPKVEAESLEAYRKRLKNMVTLLYPSLLNCTDPAMIMSVLEFPPHISSKVDLTRENVNSLDSLAECTYRIEQQNQSNIASGNVEETNVAGQ